MPRTYMTCTDHIANFFSVHSTSVIGVGWAAILATDYATSHAAVHIGEVGLHHEEVQGHREIIRSLLQCGLQDSGRQNAVRTPETTYLSSLWSLQEVLAGGNPISFLPFLHPFCPPDPRGHGRAQLVSCFAGPPSLHSHTKERALWFLVP